MQAASGGAIGRTGGTRGMATVTMYSRRQTITGKTWQTRTETRVQRGTAPNWLKT